MIETGLPPKISSARARAIEVERVGPFEVKAGDSYLHVNVRERASEERVAAASAAVAERVMAWLRERTVAAATKVSP